MFNQYFWLPFAAFALAGNCFAFSSVALIEGYVTKSWYVAYDYASQKQADAISLEGCRKLASENGIGKQAKNCKIRSRPKDPGYGAVVCGDNGCGWSYSYSSRQGAIDGAYESCNQDYKNCKETDITNWSDFAGFANTQPQKTSSGDCRPRTTTIRCRSSCSNGDCIVTYENGCKIRVQVSPEFDSFQNKWIYPAPAC